jgi:hypothetical protein
MRTFVSLQKMDSKAICKKSLPYVSVGKSPFIYNREKRFMSDFGSAVAVGMATGGGSGGPEIIKVFFRIFCGIVVLHIIEFSGNIINYPRETLDYLRGKRPYIK